MFWGLRAFTATMNEIERQAGFDHLVQHRRCVHYYLSLNQADRRNYILEVRQDWDLEEWK